LLRVPLPRFPIRQGLAIRRSRIHGRGVYARIPIRKGTRIVEYSGERITTAEADRRYPDDDTAPYHTFLFALDDGMMVDAAHGGNIARWINHSCDPNCEVVLENGRLYIEAIRDIASGEELAYDYNFILPVRHSPAMKKRYPCSCGAVFCRETMLGRKR
jgi:SET domain-containing protein